MVHLLIAILIGILAFIVSAELTERRLAVLIGLCAGVLWYLIGPGGM